MRDLLTTVGLLAIVAAAGCASAGQQDVRRGSGATITADELAGVHASNAFEAVRQLRPQLLRERGTASVRGGDRTGAELVVYVNRVRVGGVGSLRDISVDTVHEIRYVNAADATTLYGTGHVGGIIEVTLKR